jgi:hypothetical protein
MRRIGLAVLAAAATLLVLGPQAGATPEEPAGPQGTPFDSVYRPACLFTAGLAGATPFAPMVGAVCPPQADSGGGAPTETTPTE